MGIFDAPKYTDAEYEKKLKKASKGALKPKSNDTVKGGVYDSLTIEPNVTRVALNGVTILGNVDVQGLGISGSIQVPMSKKFPKYTRLKDNPFEIYPKIWRALAEGALVVKD